MQKEYRALCLTCGIRDIYSLELSGSRYVAYNCDKCGRYIDHWIPLPAKR